MQMLCSKFRIRKEHRWAERLINHLGGQQLNGGMKDIALGIQNLVRTLCFGVMESGSQCSAVGWTKWPI